MKRVYLRTFGCQMNERDSEFIMGLLMENGFVRTEFPKEADAVLFNTCSVRKHAEDRAISNMGTLLKKRRDSKIFGIIGCTAQALKTGLFKMLPDLDIVCGPGRIYELPFLIEKAIHSRVLACDNIDRDAPELKSRYRANKKSTNVSIMRGCDNYCSYCIVPYLRGRERSRKAEDIIREIKNLVRRDINEITLLGQNVNSYNGSKCNFVELLKRINDIGGIKKIKFMTSHPKDATIELFKAIRDLDKVAKELHMPLQSGSDKILKLMNRKYTLAEFSRLVKNLRRLVPGSRVSTDIIVGFPGEAESDFKKTLKAMKDINFNSAYIFKYSPRSPAKSAEMPDDVPEEIKKKRHKTLLDLQRKISKNKK